MSEDHPGPPPSELMDLLDAERGTSDVPSDALERIRTRLDASIAAKAAAASAASDSPNADAPGSASAASATRAARAGVLGSKWVVGLAGFVLGVAAGIAIHSTMTPAPRERVVTVTREVRVIAPATESGGTPGTTPAHASIEPGQDTRARTDASAVSSAVDSVGTDAGAAPSTIRRTNAPNASDVDPSAERLSRQQAAIDTARTALQRGQAAAALDVLDRSARQDPVGPLSEERDAVRVQALVGAGRYDQARESAARFEQAHPRSLFRDAVHQAVTSIP